MYYTNKIKGLNTVLVLIFFSCCIYGTEELCPKGTLYKSYVLMPENLKLLTLPVLEIWPIMRSQNGHL